MLILVFGPELKKLPFLFMHRDKMVKLLGRLPNFGSRPNTMGGKFPSVLPCVRVSVHPQKVSSISMKFGIQVVRDER